MNFAAHQSFFRCSRDDVAGFQENFSAKFGKAREMKINRARADGATARKRHPRFSETREQRPHDVQRRRQFAYQRVRGPMRRDIRRVDRYRAIAVRPHARSERFEHNDPESLDASLARHKGKRQLVIVEGIYSMDGDFGNLNALMDIADAHEASVFVDEAHSMLACGANGRGAVEHFGVEKRIRILYGTFSKAFGALGGFVCGSKETLDYLAGEGRDGRRLGKLPLAPRLAHMLAIAADGGNAKLAAKIAMLLTERGLGYRFMDYQNQAT